MPDGNRTNQRRFWRILGVVVLLLLLGEIAFFLVRWPFAEDGVLGPLGRATRCTLKAERFDSTFFVPGCTLEGLTLTSATGARVATVDRLIIRSSWINLLTFRKRVNRFEIQGLQARIPTTGLPSRPGSEKDQKSETVIQELIADGTVLDIVSGPEDSEPLRFEVPRLRITNLGPDRPFGYSTVIKNPHPPGEVRAEGSIGPAPSGRASELPVAGSFELRSASLDRYDSLGGTLHGKGKFSGPLEKIAVSGVASVENFEVDDNDKPVRLDTSYRAAVNGTNGDVQLEAVEAKILSTQLHVVGSIRAEPDQPGKTVRLRFSSRHGRIDDLLVLFTKSETSKLQGPIRMQGRVVLPPGKQEFLRRVQLQGTFNIDDAEWTRARTQNKIDELSARARGDEEEFENGGADAQEVLTAISGKVTMQNGVAKLEDILFQVPGAVAAGGGTFNLLSKRVDLRGKVRMSADVSEATSGLKSFLLKPFNALFRRKKKDQGTTLPVSIVGTLPRPKYSVGLTP